ncbi:MAG TPA: hypothetical protein VEY87_09685 [Gaiellaceae bacterium]|jgi:hypothetical protein|nr:hypothetical protein [Gaiellaceae bacterium]
METVGEHPVPVGPLAVRWLAVSVPTFRAGTGSRLRVRLRNAGSAPWRSRGTEGVQAAYHWLDPLGNAIDWDGRRHAFPRPVAPGDETELELTVAAPRPPGRYRLALDLVQEFHFWFEEVGSHPLALDVDVLPRIEARRLAVRVHGDEDGATAAALAAQEEPLVATDAVATAHLVAGALPARDWSRRLLDAHAEGFAAVGGSVESRERALRPWQPGGGRNPGFAHPLLLPSLLAGLDPGEHLGLPAHHPREDAWLYDGRIRLRLPRGRRRA